MEECRERKKKGFRSAVWLSRGLSAGNDVDETDLPRLSNGGARMMACIKGCSRGIIAESRGIEVMACGLHPLA